MRAAHRPSDVPLNRRRQIKTRAFYKRRNFPKYLSPGDSRTGCTALSPSFHGNRSPWQLGRRRNLLPRERERERDAGGGEDGNGTGTTRPGPGVSDQVYVGSPSASDPHPPQVIHLFLYCHICSLEYYHSR